MARTPVLTTTQWYCIVVNSSSPLSRTRSVTTAGARVTLHLCDCNSLTPSNAVHCIVMENKRQHLPCDMEHNNMICGI